MLLRFLRTFVSRDPVILTMACVTVRCVEPIFTICLVTSCVGKQPKQLDELLANWYIYIQSALMDCLYIITQIGLGYQTVQVHVT